MNETDEKEIVVVEDEPHPRGIHPAAFVVAGVAALGILLLLGWYFFGSRGEAGKPVPAPRSSMDDTTTQPVANQTLTLSPDQVKNAGITIETVGEQLSTESTETSATGTVEANAYKQTPAVTLAGGVVRRVIPQLGDNVSAGQTVAVIFSNEFAATQSKYVSLLTEAANARRNYERSQRLAAINAPGRGELEEAAKQRKAAEAALYEMRNRYDRTVKLQRIGAASREELEQDNTKLRTAEAELEQARLREQRAMQLLPVSNEVRTATEEALNKLQSAESELSTTRQRLLLFGMAASRVNALRSTSQITSELAVPAPASGTVTARSVNVGEVVDANKELLRVTDLSSVWVIAQVYENDLGRMRVGTGASVTSNAFPNRLFRGQVTYIDPQLDETARTGKVRIEVANAGRELKLGMYVSVAFGALGNMERTVPVVPKDAVQNINGQQIVFVATSDPNVFELRPVRLGAESGGRYQVLEGLQVGDKIVVNGSFALRAEFLKLQQGSDQHGH
ncbi:MAG TPA: efflux RND transporter periplasmic adaptor subunit [Pyrinomonadaceae bacterium]|nr:efflux RND transporter periplasmic adaptor subunit [Pyrinomonadaceae bacterium]